MKMKVRLMSKAMHQWNLTVISVSSPITVHGFVPTWEGRPVIFDSAIQRALSSF
jgi:hypothetical protein